MRLKRIRENKLMKIGLLVLGFIVLAGSCYGAEITGIVVDSGNKPINDAVISLTGTGENGKMMAGSGMNKTEIMDQVNSQFQPHVLVVRKGSSVSFPNSDDIRHHVYSFSKSKRFEIKLYAGMPENRVTFDKIGVVAVGCNIHDWMLGYIYVVDTPYFDKSDVHGRFRLKDVPIGKYLVQIWHPRLKGKVQKYQRQIEIKPGKISELNFTIALKRKRIRKHRKY
mgnify:FL=1